MPNKKTGRAAAAHSRLARTEKELKAEAARKRPAKKVSLPVKVAKGRIEPAMAVSNPPLERSIVEEPRPVSKLVTVEMAEQQKKLIIMGGVTFFMAVIAVLWVMGLSAGLKTSQAELKAKSAGEADSISDLVGELEQEMDKIKGGIAGQERAVAGDEYVQSPAVFDPLALASTTAAVAGTSTAVTASNTPEALKAVVERLKEKLE